ncbi:MAG TPA: APC family permease [Acidobacteriota bacterium]|nr:APC family permease [Acidobacteriota bacterium]
MTIKYGKPGLRRELGLLQATALAITDMIGIGPFITIPLFLSTMGGPQAMIGWFIGALLAFCDGLVWAELGAAMPKAGGSYHYLRAAFGPAKLGRWFSFLIVWQIMFSAPLSVASGSIGFANYFHFLLPGLSPLGVRILASAVPLILIVLLYRKISALGKLSVVLLSGVLVGCFWVIGSGLPRLSMTRLFDFTPDAFRLSWVFWAGLGHATLYALYDYFGYYNVCYLGEEIRRPERVIPRAILFSIAAVAALYVMMSASILSVVPWREAEKSTFIASTYIERLQGTGAASLMTLLMLWIAFSSVFSLLLGYSRIPYAAAADGNFFKVFARLHPVGNFPHISLVTLGLIASLFSLGHLPEVIGSLVATRVLVQYLPQAIGLFVLRIREPDLNRPFRMWLYPLPGIISIFGWLYILGTSSRKALVFAAVVFALGSIVFFVRARMRREWPFEGAASGYGNT